jgi:hypothetical protein
MTAAEVWILAGVVTVLAGMALGMRTRDRWMLVGWGLLGGGLLLFLVVVGIILAHVF